MCDCLDLCHFWLIAPPKVFPASRSALHKVTERVAFYILGLLLCHATSCAHGFLQLLCSALCHKKSCDSHVTTVASEQLVLPELGHEVQRNLSVLRTPQVMPYLHQYIPRPIIDDALLICKERVICSINAAQSNRPTFRAAYGSYWRCPQLLEMPAATGVYRPYGRQISYIHLLPNWGRFTHTFVTISNQAMSRA